MNKFLSVMLLVTAFAAPVLGQEDAKSRRSLRSETPAASETAEVPSVIDLVVGEEVRRFRLIPDRSEPRTEEYSPAVAPDLAVTVGSQDSGINWDRLGGIGDFLVPLLAAILGVTAGPSVGGIVSKVWGLIRNKPAAPSAGNTPGIINGAVGVTRIAEVLQNLAPVFAAIEQLSKNVPATEKPNDSSPIVDSTGTPAAK